MPFTHILVGQTPEMACFRPPMRQMSKEPVILLCGVAVLTAAFQATATAAVFGALGFWFISHGA